MERTLRVFTIFATTFIFFVGCTGKTFPKVTDSELKQLTEEIFSYEDPDFHHHVKTNLQGREQNRNYSDLAPQPFLTVDPAALEKPLIKCVYKLFDNYEMDTSQKEIVTPTETEEQEDFLEDLLVTKSIHRVMSFLSDRGFIRGGNQTYKNTLNDLWFSQFPRQKKSPAAGSSGFEHIFLGELKSGRKLIGLHSWIFFNAAEQIGLINYWGYRRATPIGKSEASLASIVFDYSGKMKSSTVFVGTSPELEISLYTLCFFTRPDKYCRVSMGGMKFGIQTYRINHTGNKPSLGTAYPVIT